jgi:hypothetical protein
VDKSPLPFSIPLRSRERDERHLAEAIAHIERGKSRIADLEMLIGEAQNRGDDVAQAQATLAVMLEVQETFIRHRDALQRALREADEAEPGRMPGSGPDRGTGSSGSARRTR